MKHCCLGEPGRPAWRAVLIGAIFVLLSAQLLDSAAWSQDGRRQAGRKTLVVAVTEDPPYTYKTQEGKWLGFNVELWHVIARDLNLDYVYKELDTEGIIKGLVRNEIDLSICAMFLTAERERDFDFSVPLGSTRIAVATLPHTIEHPWWAAIRIFLSWGTLKIVGLLAGFLFATGLIFWLIERKTNPEHFGGKPVRGVTSGIYWAGSTMASGVCFGIDLKSLPGRLVGLGWMFLCAVVLSAFIASLTSSLTLDKLGATAVTSKTLRSMRLGTVKASVPAKVIGQIGVKDYQYFSDEDRAVKALTEKRIDGFLFDETTLRYYADQDYKGKIVVHSTDLKRLHFAFAMPKDSPLRKPVNAALLTIEDDPLWERLRDHYGLREGADPGSSRSGWQRGR